jgi:predicted dehydrogenase
MLYYWGMPDGVEFESDARGGPEANCMASFRFTSGGEDIRGAAIYSKTSRLPGGLVVQTDRGFVRLADSERADVEWFPNEAPGRMEIVRRRGPSRFPPDADSFALQIEDFVAAVRGANEPMVSGAQGLASSYGS